MTQDKELVVIVYRIEISFYEKAFAAFSPKLAHRKVSDVSDLTTHPAYGQSKKSNKLGNIVRESKEREGKIHL